MALLTRTLPPARDLPRARRSRLGGRGGVIPTIVLVLGALYCVLPVSWIAIASTKTPGELFSTFSFSPSFSGGFAENIQALFAYNDGVFVRWTLNTLLFAGVGALVSVFVSAAAGYALAKYRFRGRETIFKLILAGVLIPQIALAIPQYLLLSNLNMTGTYWSVLLPSLINPFSIYLCRIFAAGSVPTEILEAGRIDGAGEYRLFWSVGLRLMLPGLITVFLLQFVAIWNNFMLPYIMLSKEGMFPLTVGLFSLLNRGAGAASLYTLVITGSLVSIVPLIILFLVLQRYWRLDVLSGGLKG
ncbi:carbohydrate ABC transporter permease [Compostimonas suwonensis]|uniref:Multiple sugar transport system permease protein n=1 Tax=Compostimonas suwonensis TaxID=1048394 RepID=A0A2M9BCV6_9MICO|nr:carbohydrate ABC transporter permease [Compostimonas suwonensis]PJJ55785.1 multiple sugar transport system permease protein [Compostimonas suwonensis]